MSIKAGFNKIVILLAILLFSCISYAQPKLLGMMYGRGGNGDFSTIIQYTPGDTTVSRYDSFTTTTFPFSMTMTQGPDGKLYGTTSQGDSTRYGAIVVYDYDSNIYKIAAVFNDSNGSRPCGHMMLAKNGLMYGLASEGGSTRYGTLYSFNILTDSIQKLVDLPLYAEPNGSTLLQAADGKLYGFTKGDGQFRDGTLFQYDIATQNYRVLYDFSRSSGYGPCGTPMEIGRDTLYGIAQGGGFADGGTIFRYIISQDSFKVLFNFPILQNEPTGLMRASNGSLYGLTYGGGHSGIGTIFSYNIVTNTYDSLYDFPANATPPCGQPTGEFFQASDGKLYGASPSGGVNHVGHIFQYDIDSMAFHYLLSLGATGYFPGSEHLIEYTPVSHIITRQPQNDTISCSGGTVSFTARDSTTWPTLVEWQLSIDSGLTYSIIPGANDTTYQFSATASMIGYRYRAIFSSGDTSDFAAIESWPPDTFSQNQTICNGTGYAINGHLHYTSAVYIDTLTGMAIHGCDSIVTTYLTVLPPDTFSQYQQICFGQSYSMNGHTYSADGIYTDTLRSASVYGCDSVVTTYLTVLPLDTFSQRPRVCSGHFFVVNGLAHAAGGIYTDTLRGMDRHGCDSIVTTDLTSIDSVRAYFSL